MPSLAQLWFIISLSIVLSPKTINGNVADSGASSCFSNAVGVANPSVIPNQQMTASTHYSSTYQPAYGRLNYNKGDGWCTRTPSRNDEWLQVNLGKMFKVCGVATQGDRGSYDGRAEWVTAFKLSYSQDGKYWTTYQNADGREMEFHRKGASHGVDKHSLEPVYARYIRFNPTKRYKWNCLRVEVYGTETSACFSKAAGIANPSIIPDKQITASTYYSSTYQPAYGRLNYNKGDGWCAKTPSRNDEWLQVDFGKLFEVCGVGTQGDRGSYDGRAEWVTAFKVSYSQDKKFWTTYKDENGKEMEFHRSGESHTVDRHMLKPRYARYIRFHPTRRYKWNCLRVEVYGADSGISSCFNNPVGVASRSTIPDKQMKASSAWACSNCVDRSAYKGRLNLGNSAWCASSYGQQRNDQWLQVDLGKLSKVCGVATQGNGKYLSDSWVTAFRLYYSRDGRTWKIYKDEYGDEVTFYRNGGAYKADKHKLKPVSARYIRFNPTARQWWNCLRVSNLGDYSWGIVPAFSSDHCDGHADMQAALQWIKDSTGNY